MILLLSLAVIGLVALSCVSGALAYAFRDFSRARLEDILEKQGRRRRLEPLLEHVPDFTLMAASVRPVCSLMMLLCLFVALGHYQGLPPWARYLIAVAIASVLSLLFTVGLASSLAKYFGEEVIARLDAPLHALRTLFLPILAVLHFIDNTVFRLSPHSKVDKAEQAEQTVSEEILAVVEEGEKEGVVDETDREMIESVIEFKDTTAGQIMTSRPEIVGLAEASTLDEAVKLFQTSGHSRIVLYSSDLDHITGVLYARDLLPLLTDAGRRRGLTLPRLARKPLFVPETKPLKDLLAEFRLRKVHMAIIVDEFGGTAGLITIEDILEELVGEISDEHEPAEPAALQKLSEDTWEIDARTYVDEVNSVIGLTIPEDEGFETLAGYVSSLLGHIPAAGETFSTPGANWTVLEAEPTRVSRLRLTLVPIADELATPAEKSAEKPSEAPAEPD